MKKSLIVATIAAGIIWYGPGAVSATKKPPTSSTTSTVATTLPETTVPQPTWSLPEWCVVGDYDIVCGEPTTTPPAPTTVPEIVTTLPATTVPATTLPPTTAVLDESSTTAPTPDTTIPQELPDTGGETGWIALAALVTLLTGVSVVSAARRS